MTSSGLLWAGLFGILDGIECSANVEVFGLKEASEPATFISEAHRQHEGQGLHQPGVGLWGGRGQRSKVTADKHKLNQVQRNKVYLEASEDTEPPLSGLKDPAGLEEPGPGPGPGPAGTAALLWTGQPLWSSGESTPHQSLCSPEGFRHSSVSKLP